MRGMALLMSILLLIMPLASAGTPTTNVPISPDTTIVLVSDNLADKATATPLGKYLNLTIITTPWGVFDENTTLKILALTPETVIIIGGPKAVPEEYDATLTSMNITVLRLAGEDRKETNHLVIEFLKEALKEKLEELPKNVAPAHDDTALEELDDLEGIPIIDDSNETLTMITNSTVTIIEGDEELPKELKERLKERNHITKQIKANMTKELMLTLQQAFEKRYTTLKALAERTNNTELLEDLEEIKETYLKALDAYKMRDTRKVHKLMREAIEELKHLTIKVQGKAKYEWEKEYKDREKLMQMLMEMLQKKGCTLPSEVIKALPDIDDKDDLKELITRYCDANKLKLKLTEDEEKDHVEGQNPDDTDDESEEADE